MPAAILITAFAGARITGGVVVVVGRGVVKFNTVAHVKPYLELPELAEIVLEESWVRSVVAEPGVVRFDVEFVLTERHPAYRAPQTGELFCSNRGTLLISGVTKSVWAAQGARPAHDANNEIDFGHIDALS